MYIFKCVIYICDIESDLCTAKSEGVCIENKCIDTSLKFYIETVCIDTSLKFYIETVCIDTIWSIKCHPKCLESFMVNNLIENISIDNQKLNVSYH